MRTEIKPTCDLCGKELNSCTEFVDTVDFKGYFCPVCRSMLEQTTRDDGTSRLHPRHKKQLQELVAFNQRASVHLPPPGYSWRQVIIDTGVESCGV